MITKRLSLGTLAWARQREPPKSQQAAEIASRRDDGTKSVGLVLPASFRTAIDEVFGFVMGDKISGILFDVGGVLVALDGMPSLAALLGIEVQREALHALWTASPSVVAHETGKIGAVEFAAGAVADLRLPITADVFLQDFCSWPKGLLPGALELLDEIPPSYRVAALSNTSAVHWSSVMATGLASRFQQTYLSHQVGHLKPASEAFLVALNGMGLSPPEVLFLDDGLRNVDAAKAIGMQAHLARSPEEARTVLARFGVVPSKSGA